MTNVNRRLAVIGLGYVGLPVAASFGARNHVIGYDMDSSRIGELKRNIDRNNELSPEEISGADIHFSDDPYDLREADFFIVAVPTPVDAANQPDLSALLKAAGDVAGSIKPGGIVVFESTVFPGVTEEICAPAIERLSGLKAGVDFRVGYSPERINPADRDYSFTRITKVVSAQDDESLEIVASVYESVVGAGVYRAPSIMVAEAAKVIENTQRDLNIALMNELAIIFDRMEIDTNEVLDAACTKWNFLDFRPGLVGGHCIGVDPYYLTHAAEQVGYIPQVILAGRRINDGMGRFVAQRAIKELIRAGHPVAGNTATIFGLTFKEDCPDIRNSKVPDIIAELKEYDMDVQVHDPLADRETARSHYGLELLGLEELKPADLVICAVAHKSYRDTDLRSIKKYLNDDGVLIDIKGMFGDEVRGDSQIRSWRL